MLSHHIIEDFLSDAEKQYFMSLINEDGFINHKSTKTGNPLPLHFLPVDFKGLERVSIMKMFPNTIQEWHTDGVNLRRHSVIIHPISDDYAPLHTVNGEVTSTAIVNTQEEHAVYNNNNIRVNLQIPLDIDFETLMADKNNKYWKIIESLYK